MLNRLGIFELFAYTLPGGLYIAAIATANFIWSPELISQVPELSTSLLLLLIATSYLVGLITSPIKWTPWDHLFPYPDLKEILEKLQSTYPDVTLNMKPEQWPVLLASSALDELEFSRTADKLRATHIMLRSTSLALFWFFLIAIIYTIQHPHSIHSISGAFVTAILSALAAKGSRRYFKWTHNYIFELVIARVVKPDDFVQRRSAQ